MAMQRLYPTGIALVFALVGCVTGRAWQLPNDHRCYAGLGDHWRFSQKALAAAGDPRYLLMRENMGIVDGDPAAQAQIVEVESNDITAFRSAAAATAWWPVDRNKIAVFRIITPSTFVNYELYRTAQGLSGEYTKASGRGSIGSGRIELKAVACSD